MKTRVLIVDDDAAVRDSVRRWLEHKDLEVIGTDNAGDALEHFRDGVEVVLMDTAVAGPSGFELIEDMHEYDADVPIIMLDHDDSVETAVTVMKHGAYHCLSKPLNYEALKLFVNRGLEASLLRKRARRISVRTARDHGFHMLIGESRKMVQVKEMLSCITNSPATTVLLTGESGTGKDRAAKTIHFNSSRYKASFVNITCSALPESLMESELFGHEKGAFTDAVSKKPGLIEQAHKGTLFLDEIGEMTPALQAKLLRFLEEKAFRRVGGDQDIHVDVRIIAATNRNLKEQVRQGRFREDLYYRLNVLSVDLPPLRERAGDIEQLAQSFVESFRREFGKQVEGLEPEALEILKGYAWPGNIRELRNEIERAVLLTSRTTISAEMFTRLKDEPGLTDEFTLPQSGVDMSELERNLLVQALERTHGNQTHAAELLGYTRTQIAYRIKKYGLLATNGDV